MKKYPVLLLLAACLSAVSCSDKNEAVSGGEKISDENLQEEVAEATCPYALMHGGVMYYYTGEYIFDKVEYTGEDILGKVTSVIPETKMPGTDGQANVPIEGSIYMKHELSGDGLLVLIDGEWYIFETRGGMEDGGSGELSSGSGVGAGDANTAVKVGGEDAADVKRVFEQPPVLTVSAHGNESITAMRGGYSWIYVKENGDEAGICADGLHPLQAKEYMPVLTVKPSVQSHISPKVVYLDFEYEPQAISVRAWSPEYYGNPEAESISVDVNTVEVDFADGGYDSYTELEIFPEEYIYEVAASWGNKAVDGFEGTAYYCFVAEYSVPVVVGEIEAEA